MGKQSGFDWKGKLNSLAAPATKKKFTAPMLALEDVYFTWGTLSNAARCAKVVNTLKEYIAVHFRDQATVATRVVEELKAPSFVKRERPVREKKT